MKTTVYNTSIDNKLKTIIKWITNADKVSLRHFEYRILRHGGRWETFEGYEGSICCFKDVVELAAWDEPRHVGEEISRADVENVAMWQLIDTVRAEIEASGEELIWSDGFVFPTAENGGQKPTPIARR